jgi:hypothetical protein
MASKLRRERITADDINSSRFIKGMNGFVGLFYEFPVLNERTADLLSKRGQVFSFDGVGKFLLTTNHSHTWMTTQVIVDHPSLPQRISELTLANDGPGTGLFLPEERSLISKYKKAGYKYASWASKANVMQLALD